MSLDCAKHESLDSLRCGDPISAQVAFLTSVSINLPISLCHLGALIMSAHEAGAVGIFANGTTLQALQAARIGVAAKRASYVLLNLSLRQVQQTQRDR